MSEHEVHEVVVAGVSASVTAKLAPVLRHLRASAEPVTVPALAKWLGVAETTAQDYLAQLKRQGLADYDTAGRTHLWHEASNPPDPTVRTKNSRAYDRRVAANPQGYPTQPPGRSGSPFGSVDAVPGHYAGYQGPVGMGVQPD